MKMRRNCLFQTPTVYRPSVTVTLCAALWRTLPGTSSYSLNCAANRNTMCFFSLRETGDYPFGCHAPSVGTVHDFSSIHVADKYDPARMFYIKRVLPFLIRRLTPCAHSQRKQQKGYCGVCRCAGEACVSDPPCSGRSGLLSEGRGGLH